MRRPDFNSILRASLAAQPNVSDLIFAVGKPFQVDAEGELRAMESNPAIRSLTPFQTEQIALTILGNDQRHLGELLARGSCDCSYQLDEEMRFRVNIYRQRGNFGIVMHLTEAVMPTLAGLSLPSVFGEICREQSGLVLVTGATASGKTTTLAAILDEINSTQSVHIVTLEDPIEFVHEHKRATFTQREFGTDFESFPDGLRAALRQAPKIILVGELRDRETLEIALTAAETGHLVLATLQTLNLGQAINRLAGMFDLPEQSLFKLRLMETLRWIVSQRLVPKSGGGRFLIQEIMGSNMRVREVIALGEGEGRSYADIIEASASAGWITFDQSLVKACLAGSVSDETALLYASNRNKLMRLLDDTRKRLGQTAVPPVDLRLAPEISPFGDIRLSS